MDCIFLGSQPGISLYLPISLYNKPCVMASYKQLPSPIIGYILNCLPSPFTLARLIISVLLIDFLISSTNVGIFVDFSVVDNFGIFLHSSIIYARP